MDIKVINGVDVSGCTFLQDELCRSHYIFQQSQYGLSKEIEFATCECIYDCHYKQLQRTQKQYEKVVQQNQSLQQELQKLKSGGKNEIH